MGTEKARAIPPTTAYRGSWPPVTLVKGICPKEYINNRDTMAKDRTRLNKIAVSDRLVLSKVFTSPPKFSFNAVIPYESIGNVCQAMPGRAFQAWRRQTNPLGISISTVCFRPDILPTSLLYDSLRNKLKWLVNCQVTCNCTQDRNPKPQGLC